MYAVIRTGGKQYTVSPGDVVQVEKLEQKLGAQFDLTDVLLVGGDKTFIGQPLVKDALVTVVVTKQAKTRKVDVFKKKRRQSYRNWNTHRQDFTELFVVSISGPGGLVAKSDEKPNVVDMTQKREDRIKSKQEAAQARRENKGNPVEALKEASAKKAAPKKKAAKKATAKKGAAKAKKAGGAKKAAKKTTKK